MKKFRFKLEALEKVRKGREEECLRALAQAQSGFRGAVDRKNALASALGVALLRREKLADTPVSTSDFIIEEDFILGTKVRMFQTDHQIFNAKKKVERALRTYLDSRRQTRMIEILRERAFAEYKIEMVKKEQRNLDELYVLRARMEREIA